MKKLNRDQAIEAAGVDAVEAVERINCDFTGTLTDGTEWDGYTEFRATHIIDDYANISAYYYETNDDVNDVEDMADLKMEVEFYVFEETK